MINAPYPPPSLFPDPLHGCNSYAMSNVSGASIGPVVCLPDEYFCDIYCPVQDGG